MTKKSKLNEIKKLVEIQSKVNEKFTGSLDVLQEKLKNENIDYKVTDILINLQTIILSQKELIRQINNIVRS